MCFHTLRPYRKGVSFSVEDILVETYEAGVVGKEQVEIFQGLSQEEALHLVSGVGVLWVTYVVDGSVTTSGNLRDDKKTGPLKCFM